jgi:TatD DNase family protein
VQQKVFIEQLIRAIEFKKPIVIHSRNADDEMYNTLKEFLPKVIVSYLS